MIHAFAYFFYNTTTAYLPIRHDFFTFFLTLTRPAFTLYIYIYIYNPQNEISRYEQVNTCWHILAHADPSEIGCRNQQVAHSLDHITQQLCRNSQNACPMCKFKFTRYSILILLLNQIQNISQYKSGSTPTILSSDRPSSFISRICLADKPNAAFPSWVRTEGSFTNELRKLCCRVLGAMAAAALSARCALLRFYFCTELQYIFTVWY